MTFQICVMDFRMNDRTIEIQTRFKNSWEETKEFLKELTDTGNFNKLDKIVNFISELESQDEWKHFI